ncbi:MAG TPA: hypothetical protein VGC01_08365 [Mucilaginibacter sp.]
MDIQTEKISLIKRLLDTDDEAILQQVKEVFEHSEKDFWNDLPENIKTGIEHSRKQAEAGMLTPHDEVMKKYAKYL